VVDDGDGQRGRCRYRRQADDDERERALVEPDAAGESGRIFARLPTLTAKNAAATSDAVISVPGPGNAAKTTSAVSNVDDPDDETAETDSEEGPRSPTTVSTSPTNCSMMPET